MPTLRSADSSILNKVPCFIIHKHSYKERDVLLDLISLEYGRIRAICKLSKRGSLRNSALLQSFVPLSLNLYKGKGDLFNVSEIKQQAPAFKIDLPNLFCAQYLNEILYRLCHDEESIPQLFAIYLDTLDKLAKGHDPRLPLRQFERVLLNTLGYAPYFADQNGIAFIKDGLYTFEPHNGFCLCYDKSLELYKGETLLKIAQDLPLDDEALDTLKRIHSQLLQMLMDYKPLQSHKLYSQYLSLQEI